MSTQTIGVHDEAGELLDWFAELAAANPFNLTVTDLDRLNGWYAEPERGDLVHRTGRFFAVRGLEVVTDHAAEPSWTQPIIVQPEFGILGILVRRWKGSLYCLLQAKVEPGNINGLQLSPTVQATHSNYTQVHKGKRPPYLEYFLAPRRGRVRYDALQSEQGSWFLHKRNRNIIVEAEDDVPLLPGFRWFSLEQISILLREPNLINMDTRTVLAGWGGDRGEEAMYGRHSMTEVLSWFTEAKSKYRLSRRTVPLAGLPNWHRDGPLIRHEDGRYFTVIGVDVETTGREVARWSQPMLAPVGQGVIAFLSRTFDGRRHLLAQVRTEAGTGDITEIGPTVNAAPANYRQRDQRPRFLDQVLSAPHERVLFDAVHSEEGGRFYHATTRYLVVEAGPETDELTDDYLWVTPAQLAHLGRYGGHLSVSARCLLTCVELSMSGATGDAPRQMLSPRRG